MRCNRKVLHILYKDHVTDEEVCAKIQQAVGPYRNLLTIVKRSKLKWYGHVSRSSGLAKTILQGTVKRGRRQGRQKKKRCEDSTRQWTGLEFAKSQRAVEDGENGGNWLWSKLWWPNDPPRLRDRWRWRWYNSATSCIVVPDCATSKLHFTVKWVGTEGSFYESLIHLLSKSWL